MPCFVISESLFSHEETFAGARLLISEVSVSARSTFETSIVENTKSDLSVSITHKFDGTRRTARGISIKNISVKRAVLEKYALMGD